MKSPKVVQFDRDPQELEEEQLARFPDDSDEHNTSWGEISPNKGSLICFDTLHELLSLPEVETLICSTNVFISGKVGFFKQITDALKKANSSLSDIKTIRTEADLEKIRRKRKSSSRTSLPETKTVEEEKTSGGPFILFPTVFDDKSLNHLVTLALETERHIWLIAIPSQIQPQLLLSFECFFLSNHPKSGLEIFKGITPILDEDITEEGSATETAKILFVANRNLQDISEPNRLGTVIRIRDFGV